MRRGAIYRERSTRTSGKLPPLLTTVLGRTVDAPFPLGQRLRISRVAVAAFFEPSAQRVVLDARFYA